MSILNRIFLLLTIILVCGCAAKVQTYDDFKDTNIRRCYNAYILFMQYHSYVGPKNETEMKEYFKSDATAKVLIGRMGIDPMSLEKIMVSERDGKPFKIRWGVSGVDDQPIVFESEGKDGKRLVAFANIRELGADEAQKLLDSPVSKKFKGENTINLNDPEKVEQ